MCPGLCNGESTTVALLLFGAAGFVMDWATSGSAAEIADRSGPLDSGRAEVHAVNWLMARH
jgi:hypothetical protein